MKGQGKKLSAFYKYLEPFLEKGNEQEIVLARKQYIRVYKAKWRKEKRRKEKELTISWTTEELKLLTIEAKRHKMSRSIFIKKSTLAYIDKRFIVPDILAVRTLLQFLAMQFNSIEEMICENKLNLQSGRELMEKINDQEKAVRIAMYSPKTLEQLITENILKDYSAKANIYRLLETVTHDT